MKNILNTDTGLYIQVTHGIILFRMREDRDIRIRGRVDQSEQHRKSRFSSKKEANGGRAYRVKVGQFKHSRTCI